MSSASSAFKAGRTFMFGPVAAAEFQRALSRIYVAARNPYQGPTETFGLAISGGVDSMALAALCSQVQSTYPGTGHDRLASLEKIKFRAFVVDHGVRAGSTAEANSVAGLLEGRGIQTQVLQINWPEGDNPAGKPNFESLARKFRYQKIGKACKDLGIRSLLLAHHYDDQAETLFMRLMNGHGRYGLLGMKSHGGIPECYGMHGIYESQEAPTQTSLKSQLFRRTGLNLPASSEKENHPHRYQLPTEEGGIKIYRPLLKFSKKRLIATAEAAGIEWFEDYTNKDPTLTTRNAIRHMYKSHHMPAALTKPALLNISARCWEVTNTEDYVTRMALAKCHVRNFETRSGVLEIRFPDLTTYTPEKPVDLHLLAANMIRKVIMLVTPEEHVSRTSLGVAVESVFPELFQSKGSDSPAAFTVAGVEFRARVKKSPRNKAPSSEPQKKEKCEWLISRQSYLSKPETHPLILAPPRAGSLANTWSEWTLYDGRYWIRLKNPGPDPVVVRPFRKEDLQKFTSSLDEQRARRLKQVLKIAPGASRWTIPALVLKKRHDQKTIFALPSLTIRSPGLGTGVEWEIRYKKLYS